MNWWKIGKLWSNFATIWPFFFLSLANLSLVSRETMQDSTTLFSIYFILPSTSTEPSVTISGMSLDSSENMMKSYLVVYKSLLFERIPWISSGFEFSWGSVFSSWRFPAINSSPVTEGAKIWILPLSWRKYRKSCNMSKRGKTQAHS